MTVGADGRHSRLARAVNAPEIESIPTLTGWYFSYWSGVPGDALEVAVRNNRVLFSFPTNDGLYAVFVAWALDIYPRDQSNVERELMETIDMVPELAERVRGGRREERIYGAADLPNVVRKPYGPGWALVGDAGCHKDPWMALGVCDAFRDSELLSDAIYDGLSGENPLDESLASYELLRNQATLPDFHQNIAAAQFNPPPRDQMALRSALRGNQEATNRFCLAFEGMIPRESFFNPENLQEILGGETVRAG
jgi:flavin-dependent dehydrogenase